MNSGLLRLRLINPDFSRDDDPRRGLAFRRDSEVGEITLGRNGAFSRALGQATWKCCRDSEGLLLQNLEKFLLALPKAYLIRVLPEQWQ